MTKIKGTNQPNQKVQNDQKGTKLYRYEMVKVRSDQFPLSQCIREVLNFRDF